MKFLSGGSHGPFYISQTRNPTYRSPYGPKPLKFDVIDGRTVPVYSIPGYTPPGSAYSVPWILSQSKGASKPEPAQKPRKSGPTQKFTKKQIQSHRTPIHKPRKVNHSLVQPKPAQLPPTLVSSINTAPFSLNKDALGRLVQTDIQTAINFTMPAIKTVTFRSRKPNTPPPSPPTIPKGETMERLIAEQQDLLAQLTDFEGQGYTAHLAENNTPAQNITFFHGESDEIEELLNGIIDDNYVLRIRLQAVKTIERDGRRAGLPTGAPGKYLVFFSNYKMICTFPAK